MKAPRDMLVELLREKERENWLQENRAAIETHNRRVEQEGAFSEGLRTF